MALRVIVAGSRDFDDYGLLCEKLDYYLRNHPFPEDVVILSGCCAGADKLGERYAEDNGHEIMHFPAEWNKHGKAAGPIRNEEMAKCADACVVFWDGRSTGSKNMIDLATQYKLKLRVVRFK